MRCTLCWCFVRFIGQINFLPRCVFLMFCICVFVTDDSLYWGDESVFLVYFSCHKAYFKLKHVMKCTVKWEMWWKCDESSDDSSQGKLKKWWKLMKKWWNVHGVGGIVFLCVFVMFLAFLGNQKSVHKWLQNDTLVHYGGTLDFTRVLMWLDEMYRFYWYHLPKLDWDMMIWVFWCVKWNRTIDRLDTWMKHWWNRWKLMKFT